MINLGQSIDRLIRPEHRFKTAKEWSCWHVPRQEAIFAQQVPPHSEPSSEQNVSVYEGQVCDKWSPNPSTQHNATTGLPTKHG